MRTKVTVNSIIGQERYSRNDKKGTRARSFVSITRVSLGEHEKIVETVADDFLFS